jgi:hypothetical protein
MGGETGDFSRDEAKEWLALLAVHERGRLHSNALPHLPVTQCVSHDKDSEKWVGQGEQAAHTFSGTPRLLLPMLKDMMRFNRPLITWDIFNEPPPSAWPNPCQSGTSGHSGAPLAPSAPSNKRPRREPAEANSVEHALYKSGERERADKDLLNKRWAEELPGHVTKLNDGAFYIVRLEKGTKDEPWMAMGLVQVNREGEGGGEQVFCWFGRSSQGSNPWPATVQFKPWPGRGRQQARTQAGVDEAICEVTPEWLPKDHSLKAEGPVSLNSEYRKRLELFGRLNDLVDDGALRPKKDARKKDAGPRNQVRQVPHVTGTSGE